MDTVSVIVIVVLILLLCAGGCFYWNQQRCRRAKSCSNDSRGKRKKNGGKNKNKKQNKQNKKIKRVKTEEERTGSDDGDAAMKIERRATTPQDPEEQCGDDDLMWVLTDPADPCSAKVCVRRGPRGLRGHTGPRGPEGRPGKRGEMGERGCPGEQGRPGLEGCRGPEGPAGIEGEQGPEGAQGPQGIQGPTGPAANGIIPYSSNGTQLLQMQNKGRIIYSLCFSGGASNGAQPPIARDISGLPSFGDQPDWSIFSVDVAWCAPRDVMLRGLAITVSNEATDQPLIPTPGNGLLFFIAIAPPNDGAFYPSALSVYFPPSADNVAATQLVYADIPVTIGSQVALIMMSAANYEPIDREFGFNLGSNGGLMYD